MKYLQSNMVRGSLLKLTASVLAFFIILMPIAPVFADEITAPASDAPALSDSPPSDSAPVDNTPTQDPENGITTPTDDSQPSLNLDPGVTDPEQDLSPDKALTKKPGVTPKTSSLNSNQPTTTPVLTPGDLQRKTLLPNVDETSGALTYSYPLVIPPGRNGVQPDLKLSYNSQVGQEGDEFGYGWSVNIPYIERVNKKGFDQLYSANYFTSSVSGELIDTGSGNWIAKIDNGDFLTYTYSSGHWLVKDKTGTQYKFGYSSATQLVDPNNSSNVYRWMLEETRDANDNYITYAYSKDANQIYPDTITYTGNGVTAGIFQIVFIKSSSTDQTISYKTAFSVQTNYRITEIDAKVNGTTARKYALAYTTGHNGRRKLLNTIVESGQDDSSVWTTFPAVTFTYQTPGTTGWARDNSHTTIPIATTEGMTAIDVNSDSYADLVKAYDSTKVTYLNNGDDTWSSSGSYVPPITFFTSGTYSDQGVRMGDFNGDTSPDMVQHLEPAGTTTGYVMSGTSWGSSTGYGGARVPEFAYSNVGTDTGTRLVDLNGDGLPDVIQGSGSQTPTRVDINDGTQWPSTATTGWTFPADPNHAGVYVDIREGLYVFDVNNDGLPDLVQASNPSGVTYRGTYLNSGNKTWVYNSSYNFPGLFINGSTDQGYRPIDINGDGLIDLVQRLEPAGLTTTYLNNGAGWTSVSGWDGPHEFAYSNSGTDPGTKIADINGDGMTDFFWSTNNAGGWFDGYFYLNQSKKVDLLSTITYPRAGSSAITYKASGLYKNGSSLLNPSLPLTIDTVQQIVTNDGLGNTSTTSYSYEGGKYFYNTAFDRRFAGFNLIVTTDPAGNVTKAYYHQGDSSDSTHGEYSDDQWKIGKPYRIEQYDNSSNLYSKTINKWDDYSLGSGAYFVKLAQTVQSTYDGDSTHKDKAEVYTYSNTTGNLTQKVEYGLVTGSDDGTYTDSGTDDFTTALSYVSTTSPRLVGLTSQSTVTDHGATKVKESKYYYDVQSLGTATKGNQTKREDWKVSSTYVNVQKTYNSTYGTIATSTDQRGKVTTYSNDTYNIYPATVTNPLSQVTSYIYDYSSGQVKQKTDPNTRVYQNIYDGLDRLIEVKQPDLASPGSLVTKTTITYTDTSGAVKELKSDYLDGSTVADTYTYFDGLHRKIQERKEAESNYSVKDYVYNNLGLLQKESFPYNNSGSSKTTATSTTSLYTSYTYDPMYRVATTVNNLGTTTNTYADWKLTVTDANSKTKDLYKDAFGNLVQVDEHKSGSTYTTTYIYNYLGNLTKITDALSNIRNFTYDGLGRRLTAQDLHASADTSFGSYTYSYDDAGNLTSVTDPKSQQIDYTYDDINRQLTENYTGHAGTEVTNVYDSGTDGKGHVTSVTTGTLTQTNTWNANNGLASEAKVINSTTYTTSYTYDRQGNQLTVTNPDSSAVKYIFNAAGLLDSVQRKESGGSYTNVVSNFDYSPTEQPTTISYANSATTTNTYDSTKLYRLTAKVTTIASSSHAQDLAYTYDAVGNVTQIVDASATSTSKTANYTYDDLYRLTQAAITSVASGQSTYTKNYTYNAIGDIVTGDPGTYTYAGDQGSSTANPHAVTSTSSSGTSTELLSGAWNLIGNNGADEKYQTVSAGILSGKESITVTYNLHGLCALGGDASAIIFDQSGWKYVSLSNYGTNCYDGEQTVTIPLSDFSGLNTGANLDGPLHTRFWYGSAFSVDITSVKINTSGSSIKSINYDKNGNMLTETSGLSNTWDYNNRLTQSVKGGVTSTYDYDASGQRIKLANGTTTNYYPSKYYNTDGTTPKKHIFALGMEVGIVNGTGGGATVRYTHTDHLTGSGIVTNGSNTADETLDYYPFGNIRIDSGSYSDQRKYAGQEYDSDTGLEYMNARYYNPATGRFVSEDPEFLFLGDYRNLTRERFLELLTDPQQLNSYSYVINNPLRYTDPTGLGLWSDAWNKAKQAPIAVANAFLQASKSLALGTQQAWNSFENNPYGQTVVITYLSLQGEEGFYSPNTNEINQSISKETTVLQQESVNITKPYVRPPNATTSAQRSSVQNKPCVTCGETAPKMYADHKEPLMQEYYRTGTIDTNKMRSVNAVQPQCPSCSNIQGGQLSNLAKTIKKALGFK